MCPCHAPNLHAFARSTPAEVYCGVRVRLSDSLGSGKLLPKSQRAVALAWNHCSQVLAVGKHFIRHHPGRTKARTPFKTCACAPSQGKLLANAPCSLTLFALYKHCLPSHVSSSCLRDVFD